MSQNSGILDHALREMVLSHHLKRITAATDASTVLDVLWCLVPRCAGVRYSQLGREELWDRYCMGAPARQRQCVERYNIVKRA